MRHDLTRWERHSGNPPVGKIDNQAAERFRAEHGRAPRSLAELIELGAVPAGLVDPEGNPYAWVDGRARAAIDYDELVLHRGG